MLLRILASAFVFILFDGFWIRLGLLYPFGFGVGSRIDFFWAELLIGFWARPDKSRFAKWGLWAYLIH